MRGWVTGVTYPISLTSSFCVPPIPLCTHVSISSSSSSSSSSPAALLRLRSKLMCCSAQTGVDTHVNFDARPSLRFCRLSFSVASLFLTSAEIIFTSLHSPSLHHLGLDAVVWWFVHWLTYSLPSSLLASPPLALPLSGRSALHWACSVNHLTLTRTLIRYGAAVDLQDNKVSSDFITSH